MVKVVRLGKTYNANSNGPFKRQPKGLLKALPSFNHPAGRLHFHVPWEAQMATVSRTFRAICNQAGRCLESILVIFMSLKQVGIAALSQPVEHVGWGQRSLVSPCIHFQEVNLAGFLLVELLREVFPAFDLSSNGNNGKWFFLS